MISLQTGQNVIAMNLTDRVLQFIQETDWRATPSEVQHQIKRCFSKPFPLILNWKRNFAGLWILFWVPVKHRCLFQWFGNLKMWRKCATSSNTAFANSSMSKGGSRRHPSAYWKNQISFTISSAGRPISTIFNDNKSKGRVDVVNYVE